MAKKQTSKKEVCTINTPEENKSSGVYILTALERNYVFGIYWLLLNKPREFTEKEFMKNKERCRTLDIDIKRGKLKIEYR